MMYNNIINNVLSRRGNVVGIAVVTVAVFVLVFLFALNGRYEVYNKADYWYLVVDKWTGTTHLSNGEECYDINLNNHKHVEQSE